VIHRYRLPGYGGEGFLGRYGLSAVVLAIAGA